MGTPSNLLAGKELKETPFEFACRRGELKERRCRSRGRDLAQCALVHGLQSVAQANTEPSTSSERYSRASSSSRKAASASSRPTSLWISPRSIWA